MRRNGTVYLLYHELQLPDRPLCHPQEGYARYCVAEADFRSQLGYLRQIGWRGMTVSEALTFPQSPGVAITFDDGCETDLLNAAPLLKEANLGATFYVTLGFLGKRGFMSPAQVRVLSDWGFEIGCHSISHPYLTDLPLNGLYTEIVEAKTRLEQMIGRRVDHFSCPGGRWNRAVAEVAKEAGYYSVATSRIAANFSTTDPFSLARVVVLRGTSLPAFQQRCCGKGLRRLQLFNGFRSAAKRLVGNLVYDEVRARLLERESADGNVKAAPAGSRKPQS